MKSIKYIITCCAVLSFLMVGCSNPESDSTTKSQDSTEASSLSEREAQLIYSRAYEAILWASPALATLAQKEAGHRDLGAENTDIVFTKKSMDYRWGKSA